MILLLDHLIFGGMYLFGVGNGVIRPLAISMLVLTIIHAIISMIVTIRAEKAGFKTNARYNKENSEFWQRRVSGVLILVFALMHAYILSKNEQGIRRIVSLPKIFEFTTPALIISVYFHILSNIRPLLISLGVRNIEKKERIIKVILTIITIFGLTAAISAIISYIGGK